MNLSLGLEYLQGLGGTGTDLPAVPFGYSASQVDRVAVSVTGARLNGDALLAAQVGGGFSIGMGLSGKFNSAPLAGKQDLDTTGTLSLIYSFASPTPATPPTCTEPPPPPPPAAAPPAPPTPPTPPAPPAPAAAPAPSPAPAPAAAPPPPAAGGPGAML